MICSPLAIMLWEKVYLAHFGEDSESMNGVMRFPRIVIFAVFMAVIAMQGNSEAYAFSSSVASLTAQDEKKLGKKLMLYVRENYVIIEDPSIANYVEKIGQRIVAEIPTLPFDFHFYVIEEEVYNAFAGPGGYIFINSGLLAAMESEEELAGIIAHEVAHVLCHHISKQMQRAKKINIATMAGVLAAIFLGGGADVTSAMATGSLATGQSFALKYSREHEVEADQVGMKYLIKAGYGGEGLLRVLGEIRSARWFGPEDIPTYLTTHPAVEARMAYLDTWIQTHPKEAESVRPIDPTEFRKVRTKLIALYGDTEAARGTFDSELRRDPEDALAYYGKGLFLDREGHRKEAAENLRKALQWRPLDPDIVRDLGKIYFHMGDYEIALKTLKGALAFNPEDSEGWFLLGRSQAEMGDLDGALDSFKTLRNNAPHYLPGIYYLGETYGKLGSFGEAHFYLGFYYLEKGRFRNAEFHLNRAFDLLPKGTVKRNTVEKALKQISGAEANDRNKQSAW
ncbi:MAG: M48 family metalloprotease [Deltaproteobacteria bacterium]|nr:M48 family metalloprotease [Deltaproteobacteria bacterium]